MWNAWQLNTKENNGSQPDLTSKLLTDATIATRCSSCVHRKTTNIWTFPTRTTQLGVRTWISVRMYARKCSVFIFAEYIWIIHQQDACFLVWWLEPRLPPPPFPGRSSVNCLWRQAPKVTNSPPARYLFIYCYAVKVCLVYTFRKIFSLRHFANAFLWKCQQGFPSHPFGNVSDRAQVQRLLFEFVNCISARVFLPPTWQRMWAFLKGRPFNLSQIVIFLFPKRGAAPNSRFASLILWCK